MKRLPKGIKALWFRMTGKYQKIREQIEREAKTCLSRERDEKQALIDMQLTQRQDLQDQVRPIFRKHKKLIIQQKRTLQHIWRWVIRGRRPFREN